MLNGPRGFRQAVRLTALGLFLAILPARAQVSAPSPPAKVSTVEDSVQALAGEVKELNATIQELRAEVARSRQETRELRDELHGALDKLSSSSSPVGVKEKSSAGISAARATAPELPSPPVAAAENTKEARLSRLEEDQQLLQAKVDEQHQTKVESGSKYRVKLSGIALLNLFGNSGTVENQDIPNLALPPGTAATSGSVGATVRQSEIGLEVYGPTLAGARASAEVNFDFMGGFSYVSNGVTDNVVRLRTATMRLDWSRTSIVGGQDALFFSPLSPTSFASLGYPALADAGNLWTWTPQIRVEHRLNISESNRLLVQGGLLDPLSGEAPSSQYYRTPDAGEQSRAPAVGSRVAWTHGEGDHAMTLGVGGYYSRQNYGGGRTEDAWAGTADWNVPFGNHVALSGEFYRGRGLGGLGAAQGRSVLFDGLESNPLSEFIGLEATGGWTQLKFKATQTIELNAAFGQDNPFARDLHYFYAPTSLGYTSIAKNQNALFNVIYRPRSDLLFALEYRYLDTLQTTNSKNTAGTVNLSMGVLF
jgi:hypothetical protein